MTYRQLKTDKTVKRVQEYIKKIKPIKRLQETHIPMFPYTRTVSNSAVSGVGHQPNDLILRPIKPTLKTVHEIPQECMESSQPNFTEYLTSTATPGLFQENPESVIVRHLELAQAFFFIIHP